MANETVTQNTPLTLAVYNGAHRPDVRNLAEMISLVKYNGGGHSLLDDPEDRCAMAFGECVDLYAAKHSITDLELADAILHWAALE